MNSSGLGPQSFVVKIWMENDDGPEGRATWRGSVTHARTGERVYVTDLLHIARFMRPYLERMGGRLTTRGRLCLWIGEILSPRPVPDGGDERGSEGVSA